MADYPGTHFNVANDSTFDVDPSVRFEMSSITIRQGGNLQVKGPTLIRDSKIFVGEGASLIISENSRLGGSLVFARYPGAKLRLGKFFRAFNQAVIYCDESVEIGDYVLMARLTSISDSTTHNLDYRIRRQAMIQAQPFEAMALEPKPRTVPLQIGDDCWFGEGSKVLIARSGESFLRIGDRSIVAAASVVKESVPDDCLVAGIPAKVKRAWIYSPIGSNAEQG